jgi:hypothetical protein
MTTDLLPPATLEIASSTATRPGVTFAAKSTATIITPEPVLSNPEGGPEGIQRSKTSNRSNKAATASSTANQPDYKAALQKSATRKSAADQSLDRILAVLDGAPAKKRAAKRAQRDIAAAFADN